MEHHQPTNSLTVSPATRSRDLMAQSRALKGASRELVVGSRELVVKPRKLKGFVELMARTNFSFLQGASHPEEMVEQAVRLDYDGIAVCDLNGLYGVARGFSAIRSPSNFTASLHVKESFHYMIGTELTLTDQSAVTLIPVHKSGYSHLCELLTLGKRQATKGFSRLSMEDLARNNEGLLCFALPPIDEDRFLNLQKIFGDRLYVPVWRDLTWESREYFKMAIRLERNLGAQLFVTNRPFMHAPERKPLFDILTCISHHQTIGDAKNILIQNAERHLKPLDELQDLWRDRLDLLEVTLKISERVEFSLDEIRYRYPNSNLPEKMNGSDYLRHLVYRGLRKKHGENVSDELCKAVEHELKVIKQLEYEDYFLTLYEICQFADQKGILYQGRGSAANSVVCYGLGLTAINPVQMELLFERFISIERHEPPDIDIDFEHSRREEVIQHIYEKYDERHAAMVCTVIRYRSRMAFREAAKVFGLPLEKINILVKFMGRDGVRRLEDPEVPSRFAVDPEQLQMILFAAKELKGFPRHLGIHTGGFLITQDPITEMVPVEKATMNGRYVIQWNKDDVNSLKLMKIDVLSLGMLTALRRCFEMLRTVKKKNYELYSLPADDKPTYDMICKADTIGVFQIESRAQMNTLPRVQPKNFYDLVVEVALVRPGPLQGGMVHPYLKRRQGKEKVVYPHENLKAVLGKTFGVPIFQEQVMKMVVAVAGFTPGESDELRRILSNAWRNKGTMEGIRERIMVGMKGNGISDHYAEQLYKTIQGFASYGFPESHAASFALLTYASCYIKRHYPDVFACALLNSQPMGFYPPRVLINDAQRHGVHFLPLDVQISSYEYTLEESTRSTWGHAVRNGLISVYGVQEKLLRGIEQEREIRGLFKGLEDFIRRCQLPKNVLLKIAMAGGFACFNENTRHLIWQIESLSLDPESFLWGVAKESFTVRTPSTDEEDGDSDEEPMGREQNLIPFESNWEKMERETGAKGFSLDHHPMQILRSMVLKMNEKFQEQKYISFSDSSQLARFRNQQKIRVAGLRSVTQRPPTAKGMCFITLEDEFGFMNLVVPPDVYQRDREIIYSSSFLHVCGFVESRSAVINIKVEKLFAFFDPKIAFDNVNTGVPS
jgi:DNA-directed DNA polymerase III PolC